MILSMAGGHVYSLILEGSLQSDNMSWVFKCQETYKFRFLDRLYSSGKISLNIFTHKRYEEA